MKIYLAGSMRGYPNFNFPAFHAAAARLREAGHEVFSPAEAVEDLHGADFSKDHPEGSNEKASATHGFDLRKALAKDLSWICENADAIALLPGWEASAGAKAEYAAAQALNITPIYLIDKTCGFEDVDEDDNLGRSAAPAFG